MEHTKPATANEIAAIQSRTLESAVTMIGKLYSQTRVERCGHNPEVTDELDFKIRALTDVRNAMDNYIGNLLGSQNELLPIGKLPPEILTIIFKEVLQGEPPKKHYWKMYRLIRVSRRWRTTIDLSPQFWSVVSSHMKEDLIDMILRKSGAQPLDVTDHSSLSQHTSYAADYELRRHHFLNSVVSEIPRWRSAEFPSGDHFPALLPVLATPAPVLETFRMTYVGRFGDRTSNTSRLFADAAERLKVLEFDGSGTGKWVTSPILRGLTRLTLRHVYVDELTAGDFVAIVLRSPDLEYLELRDVVDDPDELKRGSFEIPLIPHNFLHLKTVILETPPILATLLSESMDAPKCKSLTLECQGDESCLTPAWVRFGRWMASKPPTFGTILVGGVLDLTIKSQNDKIGGETYDFVVNCGLENSVRGLQWLTRLLQDVETKPFITMHVETMGDESKDIVTYMSQVPHVSCLLLGKETRWVARELVRKLTEPMMTTEAGETARWHLPGLEKLTIPGGDDVDELVLEMVKSRYGNTDIPGVTNKILPAAFTRLLIPGINHFTLLMIEDVVGPNIVYVGSQLYQTVMTPPSPTIWAMGP